MWHNYVNELCVSLKINVMTSLNIPTTTNSINAFLTMPLISSNTKKNMEKNHVTYSITSKNLWRKSTLKLSFMDWDVNMNELEFE